MIIIDDIEQGSKEWLNLRLGVISASRAAEFSQEPKLSPLPDDINIEKDGKLNKCLYNEITYCDTLRSRLIETIRKTLPPIYSDTRNGYLCELIAEIATGSPKEYATFKQTEWGHEHEDEARATFELETNLDVKEVAFIYKDESKRCGISPDGLIVGQDCGLELKCPYDTKVFIDFAINDKIKPEYIEQCQYSMWVTGFNSWYFASYDPRVKCKNLHYVKLERDEFFMEKYDLALENFNKELNQGLSKLGLEFGQQWDK